MTEHPDSYWWRLQIYHYRRMQAACEDHGDMEAAKIYVSAEAKAVEWLERLNAKKG